MNKMMTAITLTLSLAGLNTLPALADSPDGHMTDAGTSPWQSMPGDQPMTPEQMEAMRQQRMQMMQGGPGMGAGPQGGMMDPRMMQQMQMMRQQRMQMMQGGPGMQGGSGMQAGPATGHRGGMMPPMMKQMMQKRDQHWQQVEQRLANIENLLQQLVELQRK